MTLIAASICGEEIACISDTLASWDEDNPRLNIPTALGGRFVPASEHYGGGASRKCIQIHPQAYVLLSGFSGPAKKFAEELADLAAQGVDDNRELEQLCKTARDGITTFDYIMISTLDGSPYIFASQGVAVYQDGAITHYVSGSGYHRYRSFDQYLYTFRLEGRPQNLYDRAFLFGAVVEGLQSTTGFALKDRWGGGFEYLNNRTGRLCLEDNICTHWIAIRRAEDQRIKMPRSWRSYQFYYEESLLKTDLSMKNYHSGYNISPVIGAPAAFPPVQQIKRPVETLIFTAFDANGPPLRVYFRILRREEGEIDLTFDINGREFRWSKPDVSLVENAATALGI